MGVGEMKPTLGVMIIMFGEMIIPIEAKPNQRKIPTLKLGLTTLLLFEKWFNVHYTCHYTNLPKINLTLFPILQWPLLPT